MTIHKSIHITGKVQGVGFRFSTYSQAILLGLTGFVQNLDDGSVYVEAEGDEEKVKQFIQWCHHGPKYSKVEKVDVEEGSLKHYATFEIQ